MDGELPDLVFVRPMPGFPQLTRFVLVRLGDQTADAGRADAGQADAGRADAGRADAGRADDGQADAGRADAGQVDAGRADAGRADAGQADAGQADAGRADAGRADDGQVDAGRADDGLLYELRSLEQPEVRFLVAVPTPFFPDYAIELDAAACTELDLHDADDALVLVVVTVDPDVGGATANLLAPIVVNARTRQAGQVILSGSDWPVRAAVA